MQYHEMAPTGTRRFQIEEHPTSLHHKFSIMDEDENCLYTVKSTFFAFGDKLTLLDSHDNKLFKIRQEMRHIHLTLNIYNAAANDYNDDNQLARVTQVGSPLKHTLEIQSIYGDYLMKRNGGITCREYTLTKDGNAIAEVKRKFPAFAERYTVNIHDDVNETDIPFILTLVITLWCAQRYRSHGGGS